MHSICMCMHIYIYIYYIYIYTYIYEYEKTTQKSTKLLNASHASFFSCLVPDFVWSFQK